MAIIYIDKIITCKDCGREFTWDAGDQQFFADKGMQQPKRCRPCRAQRKATLDPEHQGHSGHSDRNQRG